MHTCAKRQLLYTGPPNGKPGANRQYDGKVNWNDQQELFSRFETVGRLPGHSHVRILTVVANSPYFGRNFRIVLLTDPEAQSDYVVLCFTDTEQPAEQVARYYRLRYQIEFVIRDAKQHTGLTPRPSAKPGKNRLTPEREPPGGRPSSNAPEGRVLDPHLSPAAYNRFLIDRLFAELGRSAEFDVLDPGVQRTVHTGRVAV